MILSIFLKNNVIIEDVKYFIKEQRRKQMKIAVIGGGLSGASVIQSLIDHPSFTTKDEIDVFEPRERLGVGFPYDTDSEAVMLNSNPKQLSVVKENPDDFVEWLEDNYEEPTNFEDLVSRPRYGKYLEERFSPYFSHQQVTHYADKVLDVRVLENEQEIDRKYLYQVKIEKKWLDKIYDAIFFAIGHPTYADFYHLIGEKNYVHNPYPVKEKLTNFSNTDKIGVIGSGATGVDLMRFMTTHYEFEHPLTYYVQDEIFYFANLPYEKDEFSFTFSSEWIQKMMDKNQSFIPLNIIIKTFTDDLYKEGVDIHQVYHRYEKNNLEAIREAMRVNDQELALVQEYVARLIQYLPALFNALNAVDKEEYLREYHVKLLFFKARVPNKTFRWLFDLLDEGKIRIVQGLKTIHTNVDDSFDLIANSQESADYLINATGFETRLDVVAERSTLIKNLYEKEFILPQRKNRFVLVNWPQVQVLNQRYGVMENAFFFGTLIGGTQYENNDAQLIIKQAHYSAAWLMDHRTLFD